ncbi:MAG: addiction module toxin RelE [Nanoarchaeota archaeon]
MKRKFKYSHLFKKKLDKLKGQELLNILSKVEEIISIDDVNIYKNLKHNLKMFKRVHVNNSWVILFFDEKNQIHFVDYLSHDNAYKSDKKTLKKYKNLRFD